jgi:gamma-glutamyl-gamma-aminobutyrate hydrolase PuuD
LDAFIITGGNDDIVRRTTEIKLATQMMIQGKPIIGICHGAFMLTDLIGGTVDDVITHMDTSHTVWYFGEEKVVNSYHNLCISAPPAKSTVLAVDNEGNCESWIDGKIAAVVWHPERMEIPWLPDEVQDLLQRTK